MKGLGGPILVFLGSLQLVKGWGGVSCPIEGPLQNGGSYPCPFEVPLQIVKGCGGVLSLSVCGPCKWEDPTEAPKNALFGSGPPSLPAWR